MVNDGDPQTCMYDDVTEVVGMSSVRYFVVRIYEV
jgi:hypothetical protein